MSNLIPTTTCPLLQELQSYIDTCKLTKKQRKHVRTLIHDMNVVFVRVTVEVIQERDNLQELNQKLLMRIERNTSLLQEVDKILT